MFTRSYDCSADSSCFDSTDTTQQKLLALLLIVFWSSLTLLFDAVVGCRAVKQLQATGFPTVKGRITKSESHRVGSGKGGSPQMSIGLAYDFQVRGKAYSGTQFRFGSDSTGFDTRYASTVTQSRPVGREVDVFYNPNNPKECALSTGLDGGDLCLAMFLTPFTLFMLGMWAGTPHIVRTLFIGGESSRNVGSTRGQRLVH